MALLQLEFDFEFGSPFIEAQYYREGAQDLIRKLIPAELLEENSMKGAIHRARFADMLPMIVWSDLSRAPCALSVLLLCKYQLNSANFFCDMVSKWLLPNRRSNVELFFTSDVRLPHLSDDLLTVAEVVISLKSAYEVEEVRRNLQQVETEIRLGVVSSYHARRILEFKGLSSDGKTAMIQEKISSLIQSRSKDYDVGIFSQMQQFLVNCPEEFKNIRDYHHISRVISNIYSLRKLLKQKADVYPTKRHVQLKCFKTVLNEPKSRNSKNRPVLGILAGLNFLKEHEVFDVDHLMGAIGQILPQASLVKDSFFIEPSKEIGLQTLYLEIEKKDGLDFTQEEIQKLRIALPEKIKEHIEQLIHPIFMPRNEEEILKNIRTLAGLIKSPKDIAQTFISFDETKGNDLYFTVILLRAHLENTPSVQDLLQDASLHFKYIPERVRNLGDLRKGYTKEATVFRVVVDSSSFLRSDRSIDLYKARLFLYEKINSKLGEVRDYNGGMILKQNEQIVALKAALGKIGLSQGLLIEKFFHSISPMEMKTSCEVENLKQLFLLLMTASQSQTTLSFMRKDVHYKQDSKKVLVVFSMLDGEKKRSIFKKIEALKIPAHQLATFSLEMHDFSYAGVVLLTSDKEKQTQLISVIS